MIISSLKNKINEIGVATKKPFSFMPFIVVLLCAVFFLPSIYRMIKNKINLLRTGTGSTPVNPGNNTSYPSTVNLQIAAQEIYNCLWNNDWFGGSEDEAGVIAVLKTIPDNDIMKLALCYETINEKKAKGNMYQHILKYVDVDDMKEAGVYNKINK